MIVFDGRGGEWLGRIARVSKHGVRLEALEPRAAIAEPPVAVTLAIGLLKGEQMSTVVRDVTAMGAAAIQPFVSDHVALPAEARQTRARERWIRIAASSAAQCGRSVVPEILEVCRFDDLLQQAEGQTFICIEPDRAPAPGPRPGDRPESALVLVGPEGGWSEGEVARAVEAGAAPLDLGPRTLRAELAPVVAMATLWNWWG